MKSLPTWLTLVSILLFVVPTTVHSESLFQRMRMGAKEDKALDDVPTATLSNGVEIPLVGLGVGNMLMEVIPAMTAHALRLDKRTRLFDTSSVSHNEHLVARGIVEGVEHLKKETDGLGKTGKVEIHVITKVWYTHLGFDRTMIAVKESIDELKLAIEHPDVDLKLHVMIHWPRCYDQIEWMKCEDEESDLPEEVKQAGPPPHLDKVNAWKGSWKALETLVSDDNSPVVGIGVSNFHLKELEALAEMSTVTPHMVETNMWSLLYDPMLVDYCHRHKIHLTAFHLMESTLRHAEKMPYAYHQILEVANALSKDMVQKKVLPEDKQVTAVQAVLAWLIQHSVSVIPRTTDVSHLLDNSAIELAKIPAMTDTQTKTIAHAVEALISGDDLEEDGGIRLTFHAKTKDVWLYWRDDTDGYQDQVAVLKKGERFEEKSHPGHTFRVYEEADSAGKFETYHVKGRYGDHHHIEL